MPEPQPWGPVQPRPRRRGWDAAWRVALLVLAALIIGYLMNAAFNLL